MRRFSTCFAAMLSGITLACEATTEPGNGPWPPDVAGTWIWAYSTRAGATHDPATEDYTAQLRLTPADSTRDSGDYTYSVNDEVVTQGTYAIGSEDFRGNDFVMWQPSFGPYHAQTWLTIIVGDSLLLNDATVNGFLSVWGRE